jgi:hypothetical protein
MDRNVASILALAGTAAISVTLAAIAPGDAYADDIAVGQDNHFPPQALAGSSEGLDLRAGLFGTVAEHAAGRGH